MTSEGIFNKRRRADPDPTVESYRLQIIWYVVSVLTTLVMLAVGADRIEIEPEVGLSLLICSPLAGLVPWTIATALRRSARIERLLERAEKRADR